MTTSFLPLRRGTILRKTTGLQYEAAVVLGPPTLIPSNERVECVHGYIDDLPTAGLFTVGFDSFRRGIWRVANDEDAAKVRALFLTHAEAWGPTSNAWVVTAEPGTWETPPVAWPWGST